ncbi:hypothetical protein VHEMI02719 [[Torrubiella] hemipterigena]|uniref:Uncharacterized protein n=1 Tax=[Torrubiella] hemipterigena TaxID=1531966 RepID=A0A0A1T953_9HYPO|nr:hypothetical protein VHEMI02719 [[Torrubiella] hemipterigena]
MYGAAFNASGSAVVLGGNITAEVPVSLSWIFEKRIYENDKENSTENALYLRPKDTQFSKTVDGWYACWVVATIPDSRKSTEQVLTNCTGTVSSDCLYRLNKLVCGPDASPVDLDLQKACGENVVIGGMNYTTLQQQLGDAIPVVGVSGPSSNYDKYMKENVVAALSFARNANGVAASQKLDPSVACFGIEKVRPGSKDLQTVLKSSASLVAVSYAAGLAALLAAL